MEETLVSHATNAKYRGMKYDILGVQLDSLDNYPSSTILPFSWGRRLRYRIFASQGDVGYDSKATHNRFSAAVAIPLITVSICKDRFEAREDYR